MKMKFVLLSVIFGLFYVSNVSGDKEFINFVNEDRQFDCLALNARWYLPNRTLVTDDNLKYDIEALSTLNSRLTVHNVNAMDIGDYNCIGEDRKETFRLHIYYPLTIDFFTASQTVKENDNVTLKCKTIGVPRAEIKWYFEDIELVNGANVEIKEDVVNLRNVQRDQSGSYACVAVQTLGSLRNYQERNPQLIVEHGLKSLETETVTVAANIGETVTLSCSADSVPSSHFQWYLNGYEVFANIENFNGHSRLKVKLDADKFKRNYTCIVTYDSHHEKEQLKKVYKFEEKLEVSAATKSSTAIASFIMFLTAFVILV